MLSCCWRGGAILGAAWLAYDNVQRLPTWFLLVSPLLLIALIRWGRLTLLLIPILIAYGFLRRIFGTSIGRRSS
jgi:hypothetical protein